MLLSYFNPNAARETLYPSLIKHIIMNKGVVIWKPDEVQIDGVFDSALFIDLCQSEDYGRNIKFAVDEGFRYKLFKSDSVWNKTIRERLYHVRNDTYNTLVRDAASQAYQDLSRSDLELERLLLRLRDDLAGHDVGILDSLKTRPEWSGEGQRALFVSVAQDVDMYRATGAVQLLCRPERWAVTQAVARHMQSVWEHLPLSPTMAEIGAPSPSSALPASHDPDALFEWVRDLMAARYVRANRDIRGLDIAKFRENAAEMTDEMSAASAFLDSFSGLNVRVPEDLYAYVRDQHAKDLNTNEGVWNFVMGALSTVAGTALSKSPAGVIALLGWLALQIFRSEDAAKALARRRGGSAGHKPGLMTLQNPDWWLNPRNYGEQPPKL